MSTIKNLFLDYGKLLFNCYQLTTNNFTVECTFYITEVNFIKLILDIDCKDKKIYLVPPKYSYDITKLNKALSYINLFVNNVNGESFFNIILNNFNILNTWHYVDKSELNSL